MLALTDWVANLGTTDLPVLRQTAMDLAKLKRNEDSVTGRDISQVVMRDPLMTLKVLRYSQSRLTSRQPTEITTVEHAIMMHGLNNFFGHFRNLAVLEDQLKGDAQALRGVLSVMSRAYLAAAYARNFSGIRHDMESDEVMVSALLHDLAEMLLWCTAPTGIMQINHMVRHNRGLRSASGQKAVLGFALVDLQLALARQWQLPALLQNLMDDHHANSPRVQTVVLSVALARHCASGWYDPALPDDYAALQKLLNTSPDQAVRWTRQFAVQAARNWQLYSVRPAAAWLPLTPGAWPEEEGPAFMAPAASFPQAAETLARVLEQLKSLPLNQSNVVVVAALTFFAFSAGLGLRRMWYGQLNTNTNKVEPRHTVFLDPGLLPGELTFAPGSQHLFARVMERSQGVWVNASNRQKVLGLLPEGLRQKFGARDFFAMSIPRKGAPHGFIVADTGSPAGALDETRYLAFKQVCSATGAALDRTA